jgi:beta-lactamase class A
MKESLKSLLQEFDNTHSCSLTLNMDGKTVFSYNNKLTLPSASMGKIFILGYLSELTRGGDINLEHIVQVEDGDIVGDSGLLQYLNSRHYTYNDLATLIGSVSDNSATNTLIRILGLNNIQEYTRRMGLKETVIIDIIRDVRDPQIHPFAPSKSNSFEYAKMVEEYKNDSLVKNWLTKNTDLSMVASAFNIDPLAHSDAGKLFNKTGTDLGIRCDAGNVVIGYHDWTYAMFVKFDESKSINVDLAYSLMHQVGHVIAMQDKAVE